MEQSHPGSRVRRSGGLAAALALLVAGLAGESGAQTPLYQWIDRDGVVRYTPDPGRVPGGYPSVLVEPGMALPAPRATAAAAEPAAEPPLGTSSESDPFNAPEQARRVQSESIGGTGSSPAEPAPSVATDAAPQPVAGTGMSPSEIDARIQELEEAIARDEDALKDLISQTSSGQGDPVRNSDELREIGRRLPELQADLRALRDRRARSPEP